MAKAKNPTTPQAHHYIRTPFAALFGFLAMTLVSASILTVWANRTITDTATFEQTVGPVIERPELQSFVADKVSDQLLTSAPVGDIATSLLPGENLAGKTPDQLQAEVKPVIHDSIVQILKSPGMTAAWKSTTQNAQAELVRQLDANAPEVTLDLGPLVDAVLAEMKQTKLAPVADKIDLKPSAAQVQLKGGALEKIHNGYKTLKTGTLVVVALTLVFAALSIWISVHHLKTLRRMLIGTGVTALVVAALVAAPAFVKLPVSDPATAALAVALVATLLHGLQVACLVLGAVCLLAALGSKLYDRSRAHA